MWHWWLFDEFETQAVEVPSIDPSQPPTTEQRLLRESAPIEYYFWGDVLWSWARNWSEVTWVAFKNYLTKDEIEKRFGKHAADNIPLKKQKMATGDEASDSETNDSAWTKGEIWEIWDKKTRTVHWIAIGYDKQLDEKKDPLGLADFFPVPPFFIANVTTALYVPTADFTLSQDLYNEVDRLQTRISVLTEAVKAVGVYDASADGVQRMMKEGFDNDLIPIENWALFSEKSGLKGTVDWLPIQDVVNALDKLRGLRDETIQLLQQITGMSDVMQGGLSNQYEGVGQSQMKAKFGSIRVQALQDQFARFAGDLMQIKAEVISRHFDPQTIFKQANMAASPDKDMAQEAIELIKNPEEAMLRIDIRPESVAMVDYAHLKSERTDYINALSTFMQSASPLMDSDPSAKPFLLELLSWGLAGFKGASEIEGVIDRAIDASKKEAQQPEQPDPAAAAQQAKQQGEMQKIQAKAQSDMALRDQDKQADIETAMAQHRMKLEEVDAGMRSKLAEINAKMQADLTVEQAQTQMNIAQQQQGVQNEMLKDQANHQMDMQAEGLKTGLKIKEITTGASAKILETKAATAAKPESKPDA